MYGAPNIVSTREPQDGVCLAVDTPQPLWTNEIKPNRGTRTRLSWCGEGMSASRPACAPKPEQRNLNNLGSHTAGGRKKHSPAAINVEETTIGFSL